MSESPIPTFAELEADPEIAPLLTFTPVPRSHAKANGWSADMQRMFIAWLAHYGSPTNACDELGKEQNIAFLQAQRTIYESLQAQSQRAIDASSREIVAVTQRASELSGRLRALKADAVSPSSAPSESAIEERLQWERKAQSLEVLQLQAQEALDVLHEASTQFLDLLSLQKNLPAERLSLQDREKVQLFVTRITQQLNQYGFSTFDPDQLSVSENFRVEKEGFEIGFQTSASDSIRLKWAYQLGLLEVARESQTNHAGMVIFDEPRQQEAARLSFRQLLNRAQESAAFSQQVIFATSEDLSELRSDLTHIECNLQVIEGWMLQRLQQDGRSA